MNLKKYTNILFEKKRIRHEMKRIQSKSHQIRTYNINKISVMFDDKMFEDRLDDGIKTLAYGQKDVKF